MKFNFKKLVAGTLVMFTLVPALAFAENDNSKSRLNEGKEKEKSSLNFCSRISNIALKTADQITKAEEKKSKNQSEHLSRLENKQRDVDERRANSRTDADSKRINNWDKMGNKAKTEAQKAAVEAYRNNIKSAVETRRTAVDTAVKAYREALAQILSTNSGTTNQAVDIFKASMNTAVLKAQADCATNTNSKIAKDNFDKAVKNAQETLKNARKSTDMSPAIQALKKTRDSAINAATTAFKTATEKARADLLLALKK